MNRINQKLQENKKILSIYFSAGYPNLNDTVQIIQDLEKNGIDMIEIGLPFSDPLADGPTIQESSTQALHNGMTTQVLFDQLKDIRKTVAIPLVIMGYFNPMLQYGIENFCKKCAEIGIDGLIIPDLPVAVYADEYKATFEKYGLLNVFLITPQTSDERIHFIDSVSDGFIYILIRFSICFNLVFTNLNGSTIRPSHFIRFQLHLNAFVVHSFIRVGQLKFSRA